MPSENSTGGGILVEIIHVSPTFAIIAFLSVLLAIYRKDISSILGRATQVELFGFKLSVAELALSSASRRAAERSEIRTISRTRQRVILRELEQAQELFRRAEILWVDDHPYNCYDEARILQSFGALVGFVTTTDEALEIVQAASSRIDLIISDMDRSGTGDGPTAGLKLLDTLADQDIAIPVIIYTSSKDETPPSAFGLTNRPDELGPKPNKLLAESVR